MRKWLVIFALLVPLAAVGVLADQDAPKGTPEQRIAKPGSGQSGQQQAEAQDNGEATPKTPTAVVQRATPVDEAAKEEARENLQIQRELSLFTGLLVLVGVCQFATMYWQARLLKKTREDVHKQAGWMETQAGHMSGQLTEMRLERERSERVWKEQSYHLREQTGLASSSADAARVTAKATALAAVAAETSAKAAMGVAIPVLRLDDFRFLPSANQMLGGDLEVQPLRISVKNYGQTPAFLKSFAVEFTCEDLPEALEYPSLIHFDPVVVLESGKSHPIEEGGLVPWNPIPEEEAEGIKSGSKVLTVYGCVWYGDVFGATIHTLTFKRWAANFGVSGSDVIWIDPEITYDVKSQYKP